MIIFPVHMVIKINYSTKHSGQLDENLEKSDTTQTRTQIAAQIFRNVLSSALSQERGWYLIPQCVVIVINYLYT